MLRDLCADRPPDAPLEADVAIIGGGIAGFVLARQLMAKGLSCVVLESGGRRDVEDDPLYGDIDFARRRYDGALSGRSRCLGGTSVKWGGALLPFRDTDFTARPHMGHPGWPIGDEELEPYVAVAEDLFGLDHSPYDAAFPGEDTRTRERTFVPREAKWPTFRNRNVTILFSDMLAAPDGPEIWMNATAREFDLVDGQLRAITAFGPDGRKLTVKASSFVICAGAIETTRLMLLLDDQTDGQAVAGRAHLGRYFQDHLSVPLAEVRTAAPRRLNALVGFRFEASLMRSLRFERAVSGAAAGFVHIAPRSLAPTGFDAVRDFMRALQRRRFDLKALARTVLHGPYIARLAWWRFVRKRLLWPDPSACDVHVVIEQPALAANRITLSDRPDSLGHPTVVIDWDIRDEDVAVFREVCADFAGFWKASGLSGYGDLEWRTEPSALSLNDLGGVDDIYHPVGTTRISDSARNGVVDSTLAVHGIDNLHLAATSVFPNGGSSNPTMTLILLTLRLADHLAQRREGHG